MRIDIFSDIVCPWCYLGRTRFQQAVATYDGSVEVTWRPFQLDPDAPATAEPATERLAAKFGGRARVTEMHERMRELTSAEGLRYEPERALRANTRDAHRLVWWAGREGDQDAMVDRLFRAYHAEGRNIADAETLVALVAETGQDADRARALLGTDEGVAEVEHDLEQTRALGITGVPFFLFEDAWAVSGAQPAEVFGAALREVERKLATSGADPSA
ncbi:MAG TPA: DsbA family oxidoreductase [Streptosporangiaceae bacterium]|nr:DsbA family oxidoreductase [Streptosporangiaceae bacterium]